MKILVQKVHPHKILVIFSNLMRKPTKRTTNDSDGDSNVQVIKNVEEDAEAELGMFLDS